MSLSKNTGGPAFPNHAKNPDGSVYTHADGMTLRDYFAGQVIAGVAAHDGCLWAKDITHAYEIADAMLKERQK